MSNNNSSANIIINSMIHHSKLSFKRQRFQTENYQVAGKKLILVGGGSFGGKRGHTRLIDGLHLRGEMNVNYRGLTLEFK